MSLFDGLNSYQDKALSQEILPKIDEFPLKIRLTMEKEVTGIYISGHPLSEYKHILDSMNTTLDLQALKPSENGIGDDSLSNGLMDGSPMEIGGIIIDKKIKSTRSNEIMAFIMLEDLYDSVEVIVFQASMKDIVPCWKRITWLLLGKTEFKGRRGAENYYE